MLLRPLPNPAAPVHVFFSARQCILQAPILIVVKLKLFFDLVLLHMQSNFLHWTFLLPYLNYFPSLALTHLTFFLQLFCSKAQIITPSPFKTVTACHPRLQARVHLLKMQIHLIPSVCAPS